MITLQVYIFYMSYTFLEFCVFSWAQTVNAFLNYCVSGIQIVVILRSYILSADYFLGNVVFVKMRFYDNEKMPNKIQSLRTKRHIVLQM